MAGKLISEDPQLVAKYGLQSYILKVLPPVEERSSEESPAHVVLAPSNFSASDERVIISQCNEALTNLRNGYRMLKDKIKNVISATEKPTQFTSAELNENEMQLDISIQDCAAMHKYCLERWAEYHPLFERLRQLGSDTRVKSNILQCIRMFDVMRECINNFEAKEPKVLSNVLNSSLTYSRREIVMLIDQYLSNEARASGINFEEEVPQSWIKREVSADRTISGNKIEGAFVKLKEGQLSPTFTEIEMIDNPKAFFNSITSGNTSVNSDPQSMVKKSNAQYILDKSAPPSQIKNINIQDVEPQSINSKDTGESPSQRKNLKSSLKKPKTFEAATNNELSPPMDDQAKLTKNSNSKRVSLNAPFGQFESTSIFAKNDSSVDNHTKQTPHLGGGSNDKSAPTTKEVISQNQLDSLNNIPPAAPVLKNHQVSDSNSAPNPPYMNNQQMLPTFSQLSLKPYSNNLVTVPSTPLPQVVANTLHKMGSMGSTEMKKQLGENESDDESISGEAPNGRKSPKNTATPPNELHMKAISKDNGEQARQSQQHISQPQPQRQGQPIQPKQNQPQYYYQPEPQYNPQTYYQYQQDQQPQEFEQPQARTVQSSSSYNTRPPSLMNSQLPPATSTLHIANSQLPLLDNNRIPTNTSIPMSNSNLPPNNSTLPIANSMLPVAASQLGASNLAGGKTPVKKAGMMGGDEVSVDQYTQHVRTTEDANRLNSLGRTDSCISSLTVSHQNHIYGTLQKVGIIESVEEDDYRRTESIFTTAYPNELTSHKSIMVRQQQTRMSGIDPTLALNGAPMPKSQPQQNEAQKELSRGLLRPASPSIFNKLHSKNSLLKPLDRIPDPVIEEVAEEKMSNTLTLPPVNFIRASSVEVSPRNQTNLVKASIDPANFKSIAASPKSSNVNAPKMQEIEEEDESMPQEKRKSDNSFKQSSSSSSKPQQQNQRPLFDVNQLLEQLKPLITQVVKDALPPQSPHDLNQSGNSGILEINANRDKRNDYANSRLTEASNALTFGAISDKETMHPSIDIKGRSFSVGGIQEPGLGVHLISTEPSDINIGRHEENMYPHQNTPPEHIGSRVFSHSNFPRNFQDTNGQHGLTIARGLERVCYLIEKGQSSIEHQLNKITDLLHKQYEILQDKSMSDSTKEKKVTVSSGMMRMNLENQRDSEVYNSESIIGVNVKASEIINHDNTHHNYQSGYKNSMYSVEEKKTVPHLGSSIHQYHLAIKGSSADNSPSRAIPLNNSRKILSPKGHPEDPSHNHHTSMLSKFFIKKSSEQGNVMSSSNSLNNSINRINSPSGKLKVDHKGVHIGDSGSTELSTKAQTGFKKKSIQIAEEPIPSENEYFRRVSTAIQRGQDPELFKLACLQRHGIIYSTEKVEVKLNRLNLVQDRSDEIGKVKFDLEILASSGYALDILADSHMGNLFLSSSCQVL